MHRIAHLARRDNRASLRGQRQRANASPGRARDDLAQRVL